MRQFDFDKLKYLYSTVPVILIIHFFSVLLFSVFMWHYVDNIALAVWISVSVIVLLFRFYHYLLYSNSSEEELRPQSTLWLHRYYTYVLIGGGLWGSTAVLLFPPHEILYQMVVVLFILGLTATALGIISASWELVVAYALLSFAPIIVRLAWMEDPLYQTIAYIVSALGILLIFSAKHFGSVIDNAIYSKFALSQAMSALENTQGRLISLLDNAPVGIFYYDSSLHITDLNNQLLKIFQLAERDPLIGYDLGTLMDKRILPALNQALEDGQGHYEGPFYSTFSENSLYIELSTVPVIDKKRLHQGAICFVKDLTLEKEAQELIKQNSFYDPLTKLPNRSLVTDRIKLSVEQSRRHLFHCAVLFIDLDHFKHINDDYGHYIGDQVLYQVSQRLLKQLRSEDTVARVGGDEFLILLNTLSDDYTEAAQEAMEIALGLIDAINGIFGIDGESISLSASIGINVFRGEEGMLPDAIIKRSDIAMFQAKRTGRQHAELYHESFETSQQELFQMEKELRRALDEKEFELYYQPKVAIDSDKIAQVEALIRWNHPDKGLIMPEAFIPYAEESGLIVKIGEWVLEESIKQIKQWQQTGAANAIERVSVNVSSHQFNQPDFVDYLRALVTSYEIAPGMIELELTESAMLDNSRGAIDKVKALEAFGVRVALDDFGTGYSSLSYLKHLPVSVIKIDRSFITDLKHNENSLMIVKTIIAIAKSMDLTVVAEGVETDEELSMLKELGCDYYQGFLCEKALPVKKLEALISTKITTRQSIEENLLPEQSASIE
ncbi:EAL domain-containing protein [Sulfurimonas sp. HSL-3221]|uniref:putative bifunctional diguanylate cyclase/phosphodiesterase n=1 Tax=Sulfurimonadaceae TaxID=2771471 RepID=UPI001E59AE5F|nr:GGDEF and EAL domain-containing protein [Sulfurimonas sp. HSL-3221]UFS61755.1 EAL domain-containing protein [Sulfurimonas sp. HSL-3221]